MADCKNMSCAIFLRCVETQLILTLNSAYADGLQLDEDEISRFSHLLQALKSGSPPHGGIALGLDRLAAILCGAKSIRDVIAFPKTQSGSDLLFKSPSRVGEAVLREYGLAKTAKSGL